jgi:hypothetical protein
MIRPTWNEVEYHLVICHVTKEDHIEIYWGSYILRKKQW